MSFSSTCRLQALSALIGGLVLLAAPGALLGVFMASSAPTRLVGRMLGGVLVALAAALVGSAELEDHGARRQVAIGNALCDAAITVALALAVRDHTLRPVGWALVALFAVNALSWLLALRRGPDRP
ncbi:MAG TPA: hypothetical protein PKA64_08370 [Myxococcota bacterium]|nr:hypothetical protein [Myxococcota bacterium]